MAESPVAKKKYTRREWIILYVLGSVNLTSSICISVQAPFYPAEAEKKGASSTVYGFVFGIFEITAFLSCPFFGKYINTLGAKFTLNAGILTAATCCILFGFLDMVQSLQAFVGLSFAIRIVEAIGASAAMTATFAITATVFKNAIGTTFATLEVFWGLGFIIGPTIGGFAYSLGGFKLPFIVTGSVMALTAVVIFLIFPSLDESTDQENADFKALMKILSVVLNMTAVVISSSVLGYYAAILEPHLRDFNLTPVQIGLMFIISGGMYAVIAPLVGWLCDHGIKPKHACAFGNVMVILGCCLIGPAPFIPSPTILWMCILGLAMNGIGTGCVFVSCFIDAMNTAVQHGFKDDLSTYALVSGVWGSAFSLGSFLGPSAAGILFDWVGFRLGSLYILVSQLIVFIAVLFFIYREKEPRNPDKNIENGSFSEEGKNSNDKLSAKWTRDDSCSYVLSNQSYGTFNGNLGVVEVHGS